jgi:hypothetical protein
VPGTCVAGGRIKPGARAPGTSFKKRNRARETGGSVLLDHRLSPVSRARTPILVCLPGACAPGFILSSASPTIVLSSVRRLLFCPQFADYFCRRFADYCSVVGSPTIVLSSVRRLCSSRRFADDVLSSALPTVQFLGKFCVLYSSNLRTVSRTW